MFEHLTKAHAVPTITWVEECDFTGVDLKLLVPLVLKACAAALQEFPELNARVEDGDLVLLDRYDIGVAVQTEQGLVVPVVRSCDSRSLEELDADVRRLGGGCPGRDARARGSARRHVHRHERRPLGRSPHDDAAQLPRGGDPRDPPHRRSPGRARRRDRRPQDGERLGDVRPSRRRREARRRLRALGDRASTQPRVGTR